MKVALLTLFLALALSGCGPGLTGTGTGASVGLSTFNATEQALCGAPFGSAIGCPVATDNSPPSPLNVVTYFEAGSGAGLVRVRLEGNAVEITAPCNGFSFEGVWGRSADLGERFYGAVERDGGASWLAATATATAVGTDLQIAVQDAQAQTLLGPAVLQRQTKAPGVAVCS
jgi:hypothetical protein